MYKIIDDKIKQIKQEYPDVTDDTIQYILLDSLEEFSRHLYKENHLCIGTMTLGPDMLSKIGWLAKYYSYLFESDDLTTYEFVRILTDSINNLKDVKYKKRIHSSDLSWVDVDFSHNGEHYILQVNKTEEKGDTKVITEDLYVFDDLNKAYRSHNVVEYQEDIRDGRRSMENKSEKFENWNNMSPLSEREQEFARSLIQMNPVFEATLNNNFEYYHETSYGFLEFLKKKSQDSPVEYIFSAKINGTNYFDLTITPEKAVAYINIEDKRVPLTTEIYNDLNVDNTIAEEIRNRLQAVVPFRVNFSTIPAKLQPQQALETTITSESQVTGETPVAPGEDGSEPDR